MIGGTSSSKEKKASAHNVTKLVRSLTYYCSVVAALWLLLHIHTPKMQSFSGKVHKKIVMRLLVTLGHNICI